jgi:hypothetical protein
MGHDKAILGTKNKYFDHAEKWGNHAIQFTNMQRAIRSSSGLPQGIDHMGSHATPGPQVLKLDIAPTAVDGS